MLNNAFSAPQYQTVQSKIVRPIRITIAVFQQSVRLYYLQKYKHTEANLLHLLLEIQLHLIIK